MRCVIGANGHFYRAPSNTSTSSRQAVTGKIGSRVRRNNARKGTNNNLSITKNSKIRSKLIESHLQQFKEMSVGENYNVNRHYNNSNTHSSSISSTNNGKNNCGSRRPYTYSTSTSISRAPFANRDSNVSDYDKKMILAKKKLNKEKFQNKLKRDPLGGSKTWSGQVPNVVFKDLFSSQRVKMRDLVEGKIAVIDFWLSQVGKNSFTSMDA